MSDLTTLERWLPWLARAVWVVVLLAGWSALDGALAGRSDEVVAVALAGSAVVWLAGVASMAVPAVTTLTATRVVVPVSMPAGVLAWAAGAEVFPGALTVAAAALAVAIVFSGEFGRSFAQGSAYGAESRFPLRPPPAYGLAAALAWTLCTAGLIAGPLLLGARQWLAGVVVVVVAATVAGWSWPRWHGLSRRWLVVVPAGLVLHDHLVLAETVMVATRDVAAIRLAPADTEAADLTGPAAGHAVEIVVASPVTAIYAGTPRTPRGTAIHFTACLVAPTRPGRALTAAASQNLPVG